MRRIKRNTRDYKEIQAETLILLELGPNLFNLTRAHHLEQKVPLKQQRKANLEAKTIFHSSNSKTTLDRSEKCLEMCSCVPPIKTTLKDAQIQVILERKDRFHMILKNQSEALNIDYK